MNIYIFWTIKCILYQIWFTTLCEKYKATAGFEPVTTKRLGWLQRRNLIFKQSWFLSSFLLRVRMISNHIYLHKELFMSLILLYEINTFIKFRSNVRNLSLNTTVEQGYFAYYMLTFLFLFLVHFICIFHKNLYTQSC